MSELRERLFRLPNGRTIHVIRGDITRLAADAIVNAANAQMAGGGGVDGAIHRAGGPSLMAELDARRSELGVVAAGQAVVTCAGRLPAQMVIHAVGPVYRDGRHGEPEALASCYRVALELAEERGCRSISFPAISTGVYGYPKQEAATIALAEILHFLLEGARSVEFVQCVLFDVEAYEIYAARLSQPQ